ncbi:hypothetical protein GC197_11580 [bacterium]|nr:hypothetical protein [bacterium]
MNRTKEKQGVSVVECIVALSLLAVMLTTLLSFQVLLTARTRLARQRLVAQQTLSNLAQRVTSVPLGKRVSLATVEQWAREMEQQQHLPAQVLSAEIHEVTEPAPGQRIELTWQPVTKVLPAYHLVTWRFAAMPVPEKEQKP